MGQGAASSVEKNLFVQAGQYLAGELRATPKQCIDIIIELHGGPI
jgi:hypothetical protein